MKKYLCDFGGRAGFPQKVFRVAFPISISISFSVFHFFDFPVQLEFENG